MRSRPGNSFPNLTQCTIRVPGFTGSLGGAGVESQDSLGMLFSLSGCPISPYCNFVENPSCRGICEPTRTAHLFGRAEIFDTIFGRAPPSPMNFAEPRIFETL